MKETRIEDEKIFDECWSVKSFFLARPIRSFKHALRYWRPRRLTLDHNPKICAWLWWNYSFDPRVK